MSRVQLLEWCRDTFDNVIYEDKLIKIDSLNIDYIDLIEDAKLIEDSREYDGRIQIYSDEWSDYSHKIKSFITMKAKRPDRKVGGRSTEIREISKTEAWEFLDTYHLQGKNNLSLYYCGLYVDSELVGLMSLGRHNRNITTNRIVLDRLCYKAGVSVIGGTGKLFSKCLEWARAHRYDEIITFSENRLTDGLIYERLGFYMEKSYKSDYFYIENGKRISKQSQKKSNTGCPDTMTEFEWAAYRGLVRVYDLGKKRWVLNLNPETHQTWRDKTSEQCARQHQEGVFKHSHIRGYYDSEKVKSKVYYGSSYELRCIYLLDKNPDVIFFKRCDAFKGKNGWRNPDLLVSFIDHSEIWEIKPNAMLGLEEVKLQISDSIAYANSIGAGFKIWTENDSEMKTESDLIDWGKRLHAEINNDEGLEERIKLGNKLKRRRFYERHILNNKIEVECNFCNINHQVLKKSYDKNIAKNTIYICERRGGQIAGRRPKLALRKTNPFAADGKKQCTKCNNILYISGNYTIRRASWDGLLNMCKECESVVKKLQYSKKKMGM